MNNDARPASYRPTPAVAAALRDLGLFASDTMLATAWAAATVITGNTYSRSRYERAAREALCVALASGDLAAAERAALMLTDEGALVAAVAAEVRAEYEARRDAERAADAEHTAEVTRRRAAAPVVAVAPVVEAPAAPAVKPARKPAAKRAPRTYGNSDARFVASLPTEGLARFNAWAEVRGTDPVVCLCGCAFPSTRCPKGAAQTAVA